jgi:cold shock protein
MQRTAGTVRWFNEIKGFGLIRADDGAEVTVRFTGIRGEGYRCLDTGDRVQFNLVDGARGPQAEDVITVETDI